MEIEFRHLRHLVSIATTGSVTGAARLLEMSQPNLTRELRRLEAQLGLVLFERRPGGVFPTAAGQVVLDYAESVLGLMEEMQPAAAIAARKADLAAAEAVRAISGGPVEMRIASYWVAMEPVISSLPMPYDQATWTSTEVQEVAEGMELVRTGKADVLTAVRWPHAPWPETSDLIVIEVVSDPMAVLVAADSEYARMPVLDLRQLEHEGWVSRPDVPTTRLECLRHGFSPNITHYRSDSESYINIVGAGLAVCFVNQGPDPRKCAIRRYHDPGFLQEVVVFSPFTDRLPYINALVGEARRRYAAHNRILRHSHHASGGSAY